MANNKEEHIRFPGREHLKSRASSITSYSRESEEKVRRIETKQGDTEKQWMRKRDKVGIEGLLLLAFHRCDASLKDDSHLTDMWLTAVNHTHTHMPQGSFLRPPLWLETIHRPKNRIVFLKINTTSIFRAAVSNEALSFAVLGSW